MKEPSESLDRQVRTAVIKFAAVAAVAIALLLIGIFGGDAWFRPVAIVAFVIVGGPVVLLVGIDTGKVLRRCRLGRAARAATWIPQLMVGGLVFVGGVGGLSLALFAPPPYPLAQPLCALCSVCAIIWGISLLRRRDGAQSHSDNA